MLLDDFTSGNYVVTLANAHTNDEHSAPIQSPLGTSRRTVFKVQDNKYAQPNRLDIGNGICIVDGGFDGNPGLSIYYGPVPQLGLSLSACSTFKLSFAGNVTASELAVDILMQPHGKGPSGLQQLLPATLDPFSVEFPFSKFLPAVLPADLGNLDEIIVLLSGGRTVTFGLTAFEAI